MTYKDQEIVKLSALEADLRAAKITPVSSSTIIFAATKMGIEIAEENRGTFKSYSVNGPDADRLHAHFKAEFDQRALDKKDQDNQRPATSQEHQELVDTCNRNVVLFANNLEFLQRQITTMAHLVDHLCKRANVNPIKVIETANAAAAKKKSAAA